jgi:hypothetical protein
LADQEAKLRYDNPSFYDTLHDDATKLEKRLHKLARKANENHFLCRKAMNSSLRHAKEVGFALIAVQKKLGRNLSPQDQETFGKKRGRFGRWLVANFDGTDRLARYYMTVALHWFDKEVRIARVKGLEPDSMRGFLRLIGKHTDPPAAEPTERDLLIADIIELTKEWLRFMEVSDLQIMYDEYHQLWKAMEFRILKIRGQAKRDRKQKEQVA